MIRTATTPSTMARITMPASGSEPTTSLSAMTMISALRMKSVRMAWAMVRFSCSGVKLTRRQDLLLRLGRVAGDALVHLVGALVGEERATEDQDHRQQPRQELPQQHGRRKDEEQLVAQRADGDLLDDRQLARGGRAVQVLRRHRGVVDDHTGGLRAGARSGGTRRRPRWPRRSGRVRRRRRAGRTVRRPCGSLCVSGSSQCAAGASLSAGQGFTSRRITQRHLAICRSRTKPSSSYSVSGPVWR